MSIDERVNSVAWSLLSQRANQRKCIEKLGYIHRNPVKRGLVKEAGDWKWSSFRHYAGREIGVVEIESEWTARDRETKPWGGPAGVFLNPG